MQLIHLIDKSGGYKAADAADVHEEGRSRDIFDKYRITLV